jgi:ABC-type glycerol-3-phosphate transport system substrate-binding protein
MAGMAALAGCAPVAAPAPSAAPAGDAAAEQQVSKLAGEIVISISGVNAVSEQAQQAMSNLYRESRPDVELVWELPNLPTGQYDQWLGTQVAAGSIRPDIVSGNYFATFDGYVNLDKFRKMVNPHTGNTWDNDMNFDAVRGINPKGERYLAVMRAVHTYYFYNMDIFDEAGVTPPATWAEFVSACEALDAAGYVPVSANYVWQVPQWLSEIYFDQYHVDWVEAVRAQPGDWRYDPAIDGVFEFDASDPFIHNKYSFNTQRFYKGIMDGDLRFDTEQIAEIVRNMAQIFPQYAVEDLFVINDPYPPFLQQQAAIMANGTWSLSTLRRDLESISPERLEELGISGTDIRPFRWGTFENPSMEGPLVLTPAKAVESAPGPYLSIVDKDQVQVERALDFVMFWTSAPGYTAFMEGEIAAERFSPGGPLLINGVEEPAEYAELWADLEFTGNAEANYNGFWSRNVGGDYRTDHFNMLKSALEGNTSPEDFGQQLQEYVTSNLEGYIELIGLTMEDIENPARQPGA